MRAEPAFAPAPAAQRKRQQRGMVSRQAILQAALALIARDGIHALTHRAIAAETAASTTYFFASLQQLLHEAFELYAQRSGAVNADVLARAAALVGSAGRGPGARRLLHAALLDLLVEFMLGELRERAGSLAVEVQYLSLQRPASALGTCIDTYRDRLVQAIGQVLAPLGSATPAVDASLLLGTIHRLEFEALRRGGELTEAGVRDELGRLLALLLGIKGPARA